MTGQIPEDMLGGFCTEELECKICYCLYNLGARRPKVLECCHRLCAKCLTKITDLAESPLHAVVCPFCRCPTSLPGEETGSLPDDCNIVAALALRGRHRQNLNNGSTELLLSPRHLETAVSPSASYSSTSSSTSSYSSSTHGSSNCLVITIMETSQEPTEPHHSLPADMRDYRAPSPDSIASITRRWTVWNCTSMLCQTSAQALVWLLGLLYFSSLPLGVYLLIMQRTTLGVLLVSLVPSSLVVLMVYGFCQCICHEFWNCISS